MSAKIFKPMEYSIRAAGWSAIASGVVGLIAYGFLNCAVIGRGSGALSQSQYILMFDLHDAVSILQFLLLIPAVCALFKLSQQYADGMTAGTLYVGVISLTLVILSFMLDLVRILSNGIYTLPLGVFGMWLMALNWRYTKVL